MEFITLHQQRQIADGRWPVPEYLPVFDVDGRQSARTYARLSRMAIYTAHSAKQQLIRLNLQGNRDDAHKNIRRLRQEKAERSADK